MKRLLTFLLPIFLIFSAAAEEWRSDAHLCAITLPNNEPWQFGNAARLPSGEMIFSAANMEDKQSVSVIVIPDFPTNNVLGQAAISRFSEMLTAMGFQTKKKTQIEWLGLPFVEIIGERPNDASGQQVLVTRAAIVEKKAYLVTTFARGDESRLEDERFMRVLKTFRFLEPNQKQLTGPSPFMRYYRAGYVVCLIVMLVLMFAFFIMYIRTRRRH